jgi:uncharacterized DUF497 family protein
MRFDFDRRKSRNVKKKHGVSLKEATQKTDDPEQFRAIGWSCGRICSVIFEIRHDAEGKYYHLITARKATKEEEQCCAESA